MILIDRIFQKIVPGNDTVVGSISTLMKGSAGAMLITLLVQPVLTRLFSPGAFGSFDIFMSVMTVLTPWATLRYADAMMLPDKDKQASQVAWLSVTILFFYLVGVALFLIPPTPVREAILREAPNVPLALIPVALALFILIQQGETWASRKQRFGIVSRNSVAQSLGTATARIGAALSNPGLGAIGLIGGLIIGFVVNLALYARQVVESLSIKPTLAGLRESAIRYRRFPTLSLPANAMNALRSKLPFFVLLFVFSEETVGYFGRALSIIAIPLGVAAIAIGRAFFSYGARSIRTEKILPLTRDVSWLVLAFGMFPTVAVLIAGPDIFACIFGDVWRTAGEYAQIICIWILAAGLASPLTRLFDIYEKQNIELGISIGLITTQALALYIGAQSGSIRTTLLLLAIAGTAVRLLQIVLASRLAGATTLQTLRPWFFAFITCIPGALLILLALRLPSPWYAVGASVIGVLVSYSLAALVAKRVRQEST